MFVRNVQTQRNSTNKLRFDVTGDTPPPVNKPPVANAGGPYTGIVGQPVQFDGSKSSDPDGTIAAYLWNFGVSGVGSGLVNPVKTYTAPGTYTVTLTVTDDKGATNTVTTTATITAVQPPPGQLTVSNIDLGAATDGTPITAIASDSGKPLSKDSEVTVTVRTSDGRMASNVATVGGTQPPPPLQLTSLTPRDCHPGNTITAVGSGFVLSGMMANLQTLGGSRLSIPVSRVYDDKRLEFIVPSNAGPSNVMLEDPATGRFSNTAALNVQPVTPPTGGNRVEDTFQFNGSMDEQALLRGTLDNYHYPWDSVRPALQQAGLPKIIVEFADLSGYGLVLQSRSALAAGDRLQRFKVSSAERRRVLRSPLATVPLIQPLAFEDDGHDEDHVHVLWSDQVAGLPGEERHYVAGLAWHGKLQIEQRLKNDPATVAIIVGAETGHQIDFFYLETKQLHDELLTLLGETNEWWFGVYATDYFRQPGEKWMSGFGLAYSDIVAEDPRFSAPRFTKAQAAAIQNILGLKRTDGR